MVGSHGEFVTSASRAAGNRGQVGLAGVFAGVLDRQSGFVGELAEIHLVAVGSLAEHADIGTGAEDAGLGGAEHDCLDLGMFKAQSLDGVGEFDIDTKVVRIQLELVSFQQTAGRVDIHAERRDRSVEG